MKEAIIERDVDKAVELAKLSLEKGVNPIDAIEKGYGAGMRVVGELFEKGKIFLPHVLMSADAMTSAVEVLEPHILSSKKDGKGPKIVMATVEGDIHDIGKNIVTIMLKVNGYEIIDLGADVPLEKIIETAIKESAQGIGLSAMMTTTMGAMKDFIEILRDKGIRSEFKVLIGGAPITEDYAEEIGADGYGEDSKSAVAVAKKVLPK